MTHTINDFNVTNRESFVEFIDLLREDFLQNSESWESKTLPDFLEVLSSYAEGIQGYYDNTKQNINADKPDWKTFSDIFKGARIYE
ncbi:hypothetical protein [Flavobacterium sp. LAR06]|uniref:DUF7660 family protein n=1 Tax=Flavobacterium sp. LAR06 TaxID=3064897 RepID=UPI0035BED55F